MPVYIIERLFMMLLIIFLVLTLVFFVMRVLPGDIVYSLVGPDALPDAYERMRNELGLDRSFLLQYVDFLQNLATGDLGKSLKNGTEVAELIKRATPYTIELAGAALIVGTVLGLPLGVMGAVKRNSLFDFISRLISLVGISMPSFFIGILLLYLFGFKLQLFPLIGGGDINSPLDKLHHLVLPAFSLGIIFAAYVMRMTRSCMLEVIKADYIRMAKAKGLSGPVVVCKHALKNALIPVLTVTGNYVGRLLGGTVLIETVFTRPGMGKLLVESIMARDYPVVQGTVIFFAFWVVLTNLIVDLLYTLINPRIRYD